MKNGDRFTWVFRFSGVYNSLRRNLFLLESYSILGSEAFSHHWPLGTLMALTQRVGFACPRQLDAGGRRRKLLQIVITPHCFFRKKKVLWLITSSAPWSIMVQMQNQLQSGTKLAQYLCIDWLIATMGSVCYESQYNRSYDHLKQCWFLALPSLYSKAATVPFERKDSSL